MRYVLAVLVFILAGCASITTPPAEEVVVRSDWRAYADRDAERWVRMGLVTPSVATVEPPVLVSATYHPGKNYSVLAALGSVHSQNSMGAMVKDQYAVYWVCPGDARVAPARWLVEMVTIGGEPTFHDPQARSR